MSGFLTVMNEDCSTQRHWQKEEHLNESLSTVFGSNSQPLDLSLPQELFKKMTTLSVVFSLHWIVVHMQRLTLITASSQEGSTYMLW